MRNHILKYVNCPLCGRTLGDIKADNRIGCINCLAIFREAIIELLKEKEADITYKGKSKQACKVTQELILPIEKLKELLQKSVEEEDYEAAISFRNEIRKLEQT